MNANELADCLNKMATILYNRGRIPTGSDYNLMYKAETMLRQQQAEINIAKEVYEKLLKENIYFMNKNKFLLSVIEDKDAEIAILRKASGK